MENFIAEQTSPNPSLLCSILKSIFFGLSSVGFAWFWRCPDSQQSCWVTMPQSELEICYCALKSFFKESAISACLILHSISFWLRFIYLFFHIRVWIGYRICWLHPSPSWYKLVLGLRAWPQVKLWNTWNASLAPNHFPFQPPPISCPFLPWVCLALAVSLESIWQLQPFCLINQLDLYDNRISKTMEASSHPHHSSVVPEVSGL